MALIQFNNVYKGFSGEYILKNLNFSIDERDKIGLIGQNGAGKTTLMNILYCLYKQYYSIFQN